MKVLTIRNKAIYNKHTIHILHDAISDGTYEMKLRDITATKTLKGCIYRGFRKAYPQQYQHSNFPDLEIIKTHEKRSTYVKCQK